MTVEANINNSQHNIPDLLAVGHPLGKEEVPLGDPLGEEDPVSAAAAGPGEVPAAVGVVAAVPTNKIGKRGNNDQAFNGGI